MNEEPGIKCRANKRRGRSGEYMADRIRRNGHTRHRMGYVRIEAEAGGASGNREGAPPSGQLREKNEEQGMARGKLKYHPCPLGAGMDGSVRYMRDARDQRAEPIRRVRR